MMYDSPSGLQSSAEHRQIVILCDGTNANLTGRRSDTHVVTLAELLAAHPDPRRLVMYDPGVGSSDALPSARFTDQWLRRLQRLQGLVQGRGVFENIVEGYEFLVRHWRPGDEIFLFGYSRGAFTARSIAGLVNRFGIVRADAAPVMTTLLNVYFSGDGDGGPASEQARRLFTPADARKVRVQFIGVWDTVEAVGAPPFRARFSARPTLVGKQFMHVRQALALDETRRMFRPRLYAEPDGRFETSFGDQGTVEQRWFRGAHADVGAQVPAAEAGLGAEAFDWVVAAAVDCGLRLEIDGAAPWTEDAVARAVMALPGHARADTAAGDVQTWGARAVLHDAVRMDSLWALTGLAPRDTRLEIGARPSMKEHPSVARRHTRVPTRWQTGSVFDHVMRSLPLVMAILIGAIAWVGMGKALTTGQLDVVIASPWSLITAAYDANEAFQRWQLLGPWNVTQCALVSGPSAGPTSIHLCSAARALTWDLVFIACYAYVGARMVSWAYGRCIGQRRVSDVPSRFWTMLGLALPLALVADLAENSMTLLTTSLLTSQMRGMQVVAGATMAAASVAKWVGIVGVLLLWSIALLRRPAVPRSRAVAGMSAAAAPVVSIAPSNRSKRTAVVEDEPLPGQRVVRGRDGFERPTWADKRDDAE